MSLMALILVDLWGVAYMYIYISMCVIRYLHVLNLGPQFTIFATLEGPSVLGFVLLQGSGSRLTLLELRGGASLSVLGPPRKPLGSL